MAKENELKNEGVVNNNNEQAPKEAPKEAPKAAAQETPEFITTNVSQQDPDSAPIGPGSPDTKTPPYRASINVAEATEAAPNKTQVKGGRYRKFGVLYNANGKKINEDGSLVDEG